MDLKTKLMALALTPVLLVMFIATVALSYITVGIATIALIWYITYTIMKYTKEED